MFTVVVRAYEGIGMPAGLGSFENLNPLGLGKAVGLTGRGAGFNGFEFTVGPLFRGFKGLKVSGIADRAALTGAFPLNGPWAVVVEEWSVDEEFNREDAGGAKRTGEP